MTQYYKNETGKACAELIRAMDRFSAGSQDTLEVMREIETACSLPFTAIVNNTNLGPLTTAEDVIASLSYAEALSRAAALPVKMTCAREDLCPSLENRVENLFPLRLQKLYYELKTEVPNGKTDI